MVIKLLRQLVNYWHIKFLKYILLLFIFLNLFQQVSFAQNFSEEEQHYIDSLNKVIAEPTSPDTSLAEAYVLLSEILYLVNIDTLNILCKKAQVIAENRLLTPASESLRKS